MSYFLSKFGSSLSHEFSFDNFSIYSTSPKFNFGLISVNIISFSLSMSEKMVPPKLRIFLDSSIILICSFTASISESAREFSV